MTEKQLKALKWAVSETNKQLMLAEIAYEQTPKNVEYKRNVDYFRELHEGLSELLEGLGSKA